MRAPVLNTFIAVTTILFLLCTLVLLRVRLWPERAVRSVSTTGRRALLLILAFPPAALLMFLLDGRPQTTAEVLQAFLLTLAVLWVVGLLLERILSSRAVVAVFSVLVAVAISLDQLAGAPLAFTGFLTYSQLHGARYYGLGNEGAALLFGASAVGMALVLDELKSARWKRLLGMWGIPIVGLSVALIATSPMIGANIAVAIWAVVGFMAMWIIYNHIKVDWRAVVLGIVIIGLIIAAFSFLDMRAEPGERSHLARAWESFAQGGVSELWMIVERKAETNLRVLTRTNWTFLLIAVLALLGFMRWRPQGDFAAALRENPGYSAAMAGCLIGGFTAYFTEDSGIVIPALIAIYIGVGILHLMLSRLSKPAADAVDRGVV